MLFIPARAANLPVSDKPVMLLSLVFAPAWLGLSFYDNRTASLLRPVRRIELPHLQRGEGEAIRKRAARTVLTGMRYSIDSATRQGSSSLTRFIGQSAMTLRT